MTNQIQAVKQFNQLANEGDNFDKFNVRSTSLYFGLILEEVAECMTEIFSRHGFQNSHGHHVSSVEQDTVKSIIDMANHFKRGSYDQLVQNSDKVTLVDGCVDTLYVSIGCLLAQGADVEGAFNEVQRSNMSKVDAASGRMLKDSNGKVIKPSTYSPPDLKPFIKD
jgi:predicted HAD superfamily Cof-like phosphohydrolase